MSKETNDYITVLKNFNPDDKKQLWIKCEHPEGKYIKFKNVATGKYLSSANHHIWIEKNDKIFSGNRTSNYLVSEEDCDDQKWYLGPNNTIRHLGDGRCLGVYDGNINQGE